MPRASKAPQAVAKPKADGRPRLKRRSRPTVAENGPHRVDVHVGSRVRLARLLAGRTQQWLAEKVALTFQQIQKYERGANRVSCSMLSEFAEALDRPVGWFFEDDESVFPTVEVDPAVGERQRLIYELTSNFTKIKNENDREHIVALVRAIAGGSTREAD